MKNGLVLVGGLAVLALGSRTAHAGSRTAFAGGSEGSIGVGLEIVDVGFDRSISSNTNTPIPPIGGISIHYDAGEFHAGALVGFHEDVGFGDGAMLLGGRCYYHLHSTAMFHSAVMFDFGIGGSADVLFIDGGRGSITEFLLLRPELQVRAFVASHVALSFTAGLTIGVNDANGSGHLAGGAGFHYFF